MTSRNRSPLVAPNWEDRGSGVRSVQVIHLPSSARAFDRWGKPTALEHLLRSYFAGAEQSVGSLARIRWESGGPVISLRWPPLPLIAMGPPTLELGVSRRAISVPIRGGLLAIGDSSAQLSIILSRQPPGARADVELVGYRPRGNRIPVLRGLYRWLQAWVHVRVGRRFLLELRRQWEAEGVPPE